MLELVEKAPCVVAHNLASPDDDFHASQAAGVVAGGRGALPGAEQRARAVPDGRAPRRVRPHRGPRAGRRRWVSRRGPRRGRRCLGHRVAALWGAPGRGRGRGPDRAPAVQGQLRRVRAAAQAEASVGVHTQRRRAMERGPGGGESGGRARRE